MGGGWWWWVASVMVVEVDSRGVVVWFNVALKSHHTLSSSTTHRHRHHHHPSPSPSRQQPPPTSSAPTSTLITPPISTHQFSLPPSLSLSLIFLQFYLKPMSTTTAATPVKPPRRFPPPCWTKEEAVALIDAYRERWFALHRGCLRTADWDAVAAVVTSTCPGASPAKTSAQCRHKMEKLRQRYRAEKQRALSFPGDFLSNWFYFENMNFMELPSAVAGSNQNAADNRVSSGGGVLIKGVPGRNLNSKRTHEKSNLNSSFRPDLNPNPVNQRYPRPANPTYMEVESEEEVEDESDIEERFVPPVYNGKRFGKFGGKSESVHGDANGYGMRNSSSSSRGGGGRRESDPIAEMVSSINMLGEGFVKMEKMKMEMNREIEKMRIEMEMKRNAMVLELQQQVVDAFVTVMSEKKQKKKAKTEATPES